MKILKKLACILTVSIVATSSLSCIYAKERNQEISQAIKGFNTINGFGVNLKATTSNSTYYAAPTLSNIRQVTIDSKLCIMIHVETSTGINDVRIAGKQATQRTGSYLSGDYYIEAEGTKEYRFWVRDNKGQEREISQYITISDSSKPSLWLSKTYKNGYCYLVVEASDNVGISSVKIDGSTADFDKSNGKEEYRVYKSKTYTVEVKDAAGNTTTEKIDINIDDSASLTLDKILKNGKWYIIIKSYPTTGNNINKVTVNGSKITFNSKGETLEYQVSNTGNYEVIVTDSNNQQIKQTIYVDCSINNDSYKPTLTAVANDIGGVMAVTITAYPSKVGNNTTLTKLTVNGMDVSIPANGGKADYLVSVSGSYTVVVTDSSGNTSTQTVSVTVPNKQNTITGNTNAGTGSSSKAVFKIKQSSYTLNGVTQTMDSAPTLKNGRTMLPVRYVAYALNIEPSKIIWDTASKTVVIYDGNNIIKAPLNSKTITVNGVDQTMEVPATMINGRVYIPISQIAKAFSGVSINWNSETKEATIIRN